MAIGSKLNCLLALTFLMAYCCLESAAMDGCPSDYQWRCGDVCMRWTGTCQCGEEGGINPNKTFKFDQGLWCCKSTAENCTVVKNGVLGPEKVKCKGKKLELSQQCHDQDPYTPICNHYGDDKYRNYITKHLNGPFYAKRSHLNICNDKSTCVEETAMCKGTSFCDNKEDLQLCKNETLWKNTTKMSSSGYVQCKGSGQWIKNEQHNDGVFDCVNRRDEFPFKRTWSEKVEDWRSKRCIFGPSRRCLGNQPDVCINPKDWGDLDDGCPDHSDKVKDPNSETPDDPCGGDTYTYTYNDGFNGLQKTAVVDWDWFYCPQSKKCIHRIGRCDKIPHPECTFKNETTGKTIAEDEVGCDYITRGLTSNSATHQCQSRSHNVNSLAVLSTFFNWTLRKSGSSGDDSYQYNHTVIAQGTIVTIKATRCDGVIECFDGSDEEWCGGMELYQTFLAVISSLLCLTMATLVAKTCLLKIFGRQTRMNLFRLINSHCVVQKLQRGNHSDIRDLITSNNCYLGVSLRIINIQGSGQLKLKERRKNNNLFLDCLIEVKGSRPLALVWLKAKVDPKTCDTILSDHGYTGKPLQVLKKTSVVAKNKVETGVANAVENRLNPRLKSWARISYFSQRRFFSVALTYLDLTMDSILLFTVLIVLGSAIGTYTLFATQVALLLLFSILVPVYSTGIQVAYSRPLIVLGPDEWAEQKSTNYLTRNQLIGLRILTVLLSPLVPALILMSEEEAEKRQNSLKDKIASLATDGISNESDLEEAEMLSSFLHECRLGLLTFKINELNVELVIQVSVHLAMILLSQTDYPLENGLQAVFKDTKEGKNTKTALAFLIISVIWSFKTTALTATKVKEAKSFLPATPKVLLLWRYLTVAMVRVGCIVAGVGAIIGVVGMMNHYHAEKVPLNPEIWSRNNPDSQMWMITDSTLVSKAGLWKSKDMHLIPLENEMFNSADIKVHDCDFIEVTQIIYSSDNDVYMRTDYRASTPTRNSTWFLLNEDRAIFYAENATEWRLGKIGHQNTNEYYYKGSQELPLQSEEWSGKQRSVQVKCISIAGRDCEFIEVTQIKYSSDNDIYVRTNDRASTPTKNSTWKHPNKDEAIFYAGNSTEWRLGRISNTNDYFFKGSQQLPLQSEIWNGKYSWLGSVRVKCTSIAEFLNSKEYFKQINEGNKVYYVTNTRRNKFIGIKEDYSVEFLKDLNYLKNSLWIKKEVDSTSFTLTSFTAQKNLIGISAKKFGLVDKDDDFLFHFWNPNATEFQNLSLTDLFRSDYSGDDGPRFPKSSLYSLVHLGMAFGLIGVGYFLYGLLLLAIKYCINKGFYDASKIDKLVHITGALNLPEAYGDWDDDGNLSITEHGQRWKAILSEMLLMSALQYITNLMLLIPFFVTGYNVKVRHELLSGAIGTFEEENEAYLLISRLLWVLPMTVTIAALMDVILVYCFMKWAHPWSGILAENEKTDNFDGTEAVPNPQSSNIIHLLMKVSFVNDILTYDDADPATCGQDELELQPQGHDSEDRQSAMKESVNTANTSIWQRHKCLIISVIILLGVSSIAAILAIALVPPPPVKCVVSEWSECKTVNLWDCGPGTQKRTVLTPASYGGQECPSQLTQDCDLKKCPVNCLVSEWSECKTANLRDCGPGTQKRTALTPASYGGQECHNQLTQDCYLKNCPGSINMIIGGADSDFNPYNDTQIVNLSNQTRSCNNLAEYPIAVFSATGAFVSGHLIICGGKSARISRHSECYHHSKAFNSWNFLTNMTTIRTASASVPVNGKLLVLGGWDGDNYLATSEYVSPDGDASQPGPDLPEPRSSHCAVKLSNGQVILLGGYPDKNKKSAIIFHPDTGFDQSLPPLKFDRVGFGCATFNSPLHDNREVVLAVGGYKQATAEVLDYTQPKPAWKTIAGLPTDNVDGQLFWGARAVTSASGKGAIVQYKKYFYELTCEVSECTWRILPNQLNPGVTFGFMMTLTSNYNAC